MSELGDLLRAGAVASTSTLEKVFAEEPVDLTTFVVDKKFLGNPRLSDPQYDAVRHVEQIFYPELYEQMVVEFGDYWKPVRFINFATLEWGKGGGKDHVCRIMSMRVAYLLLCLRNPQQYFGMPEQDTIHLLNVASSANQAQQAFFIPITRAVKHGWFKDRCVPKLNAVSWEKNVEAISGHSDSESQEGLNLMLAIADEIDAFRSKEEIERFRGRGAREPTKSAEGILRMMRTSAATRFPRTFKNVRISYPRYLGSTIQNLLRIANTDIEKKGEHSRHYASGPYATWEVNPRVTGPEDFAEDYEEDASMARSMYECKPSRASEPYFRNVDAVDACLLEVDRQPVELSYRFVGKNWEPVYDMVSSFKPIVGAQYALHGDIAIKGDRAGVAMAHVIRWDEVELLSEDEEGGIVTRTEARPIVKVDFVFAYEADLGSDPPREVQVRWYRQLAFELIRRGFNIRRYSFDGFQSTDSMQILETYGIESKRVSTDATEEPWRNLRDLMYEDRLTCPRHSLLRTELLSLSRGTSGKVDHPPNGSKDLADSVAGAVLGAVLLGGREDEDAVEAVPVSDVIELLSPVEFPLGLEGVSSRWTH